MQLYSGSIGVMQVCKDILYRHVHALSEDILTASRSMLTGQVEPDQFICYLRIMFLGFTSLPADQLRPGPTPEYPSTSHNHAFSAIFSQTQAT